MVSTQTRQCGDEAIGGLRCTRNVKSGRKVEPMLCRRECTAHLRIGLCFTHATPTPAFHRYNPLL